MKAGTSAAPNDHDSLFLQVCLFFLDVLFFAWYCICTIVLAFVFLPPNYFYYRAWKQGRIRLAARRFIRFYGRCIVRLSWPMVRIDIENIEVAKNIEPCIYVLNHFSFADVFFCSFLPGYHTVIAVRSWPFKIPFLNIFMRLAGYLDVEKNSSDDILSYAAWILKSGACICFFPEGHRSRTGQLLPLAKGAFRIAAENDVPVVPITLTGTEYLGGYKSRLLRPCRVRMRFFPPMRAESNNFTAVNDLREKVRDLYLREAYDKG